MSTPSTVTILPPTASVGENAPATTDIGPVAPGTPTPIVADGQTQQQMNEQTASFVMRTICVTICLCAAGVVGVLCFRVAVDGNAPVTLQVTQQLAGMVPPMMGALVLALLGNKGVSAIISKWAGTGGSSGSGGGQS